MPPKLVKRPSTQSNARRDDEFRSLAGTPVGQVHKYFEKEIDEAHLKISKEVVAVQLAEAGGAQKRARAAWRPEGARKKPCGDYAQDDSFKDSEMQGRGNGRAGSSSSQGATCIILGQGEISAPDLGKYGDSVSHPSRIDQPSTKGFPTVPKQDYSPVLLHAKTPPNSPQVEDSRSFPCGNMRGSFSQETILKVPDLQWTIEKPGDRRKVCQNGIATSAENVFTGMAKPLQSSIVMRPKVPIDTPSGQPHSHNISGTSTISRLPITDLLNNTSVAGDVKPPQPITMKTTSSGQPVTDTGLGKLQGEMPAGFQANVKRSTTSRRTLPKIAPFSETSSLGQASKTPELTLVRASDHKSASGAIRERMPLDRRVVVPELTVSGKIFIPKSDDPGVLVMLSIDSFWSQDAPDFFRLYSQIAGVGGVSVLSFGLPDVTWQGPQTGNISSSDPNAFYALKRTIWNFFCTFLTMHPRPAVFRVMVTAPARHLAGDKLHFLPSASQASVSNTRISSSLRVMPRGFQPTLESRDAGPPTQGENSTTGFPAVPTRNSMSNILRDRLPPLQIAPAPQYILFRVDHRN